MHPKLDRCTLNIGHSLNTVTTQTAIVGLYKAISQLRRWKYTYMYLPCLRINFLVYEVLKFMQFYEMHNIYTNLPAERIASLVPAHLQSQIKLWR